MAQDCRIGGMGNAEFGGRFFGRNDRLFRDAILWPFPPVRKCALFRARSFSLAMNHPLVSIPCVVSAAATVAGIAAQVGLAASGVGTIATVAALGGVAANVFAGFLYDRWGKRTPTPGEIAANGQLRAAVAEAIRGTILSRQDAEPALPFFEKSQLKQLADAAARLWPTVEDDTMAVVATMAPQAIPVRVTDYYQRRTQECATVEDWRAFLTAADSTVDGSVLTLAAEALHTSLVGYLTAYLATGEGAAREACQKLNFRLLTRLMEFAENADAHLVAIRADQRLLLQQFKAEAGPVIDAMEKNFALVREDIRALGGRVDAMLGLVAVRELRSGSRQAKKEAGRFIRDVRGIASD